MSSRPSDQQWHLTELCEDTVNVHNAYGCTSFSNIYPQQQVKERSETQQLHDGVYKSNFIATSDLAEYYYITNGKGHLS